MIQTSASERQTSQSSLKLLHILECLADSRVPLRLQELSQQVGMTQSTVLRYLYALEDANYVYQEDNSSRYALTWRVCRLSENLHSHLSLRNITAPFINRLANSLSLGACLVVEQNYECIYLDCIDNPSSPTLQRVGTRAPMHATGSGKVLLSQYNSIQLAEYISAKGLTQYTEHTITDPDLLRQELTRIRQQGFGLDNEECEIGLRCISIPLRDYSGQIIASISVFGRTADMTDSYVQSSIYPALKEATTVISSRLGYSPIKSFDSSKS